MRVQRYTWEVYRVNALKALLNTQKPYLAQETPQLRLAKCQTILGQVQSQMACSYVLP